MIDWCHSDQSDGVLSSQRARRFCWLGIPVTFLVFVEKKVRMHYWYMKQFYDAPLKRHRDYFFFITQRNSEQNTSKLLI